MRRACLIQIVLVVAAGTATSFSQSYPEAALCQWDLVGGEIPNSPLMADIMEKTRSVGSDGLLAPLTITERVAGYVARDSKGKVVMRTYDAPDRPRSTPGFKDSDGWVQVVCDPRRKTVVEAFLPAHESRGHGITRFQNHPNSYHTTATFHYFHYKVPGRENLGEETFEGVPAFRYRFPRASVDVQKGHLVEAINADDLAVQLLRSLWMPNPPSEVERLTNLRFPEPPKKLLDVPAWAFSSSPLPQPMVPPGMQFPGGGPPHSLSIIKLRPH
jgi:hypothetical protein